MKVLLLLNVDFTLLLKAVSWTLFHSLWLSACAGVLVLIGEFIFPRKKFRFQYYFIVSFLLLLGILLLLKCAIEVQKAYSPDRLVDIRTLEESVGPEGIGTFIHYFNEIALVVFIVWILMATTKLAILFHSYKQLNKLRTAGALLPDPKLEEWFQATKKELGVKGHVGLILTETVTAPVMIGYNRPTILLPISLVSQLQVEQTKLIILHELIHIKQKDGWIHGVEAILRCFLFFNPLFLWLCNVQEKRREISCDQAVINYSKRKDVYIRTLVLAYEYAVNATNKSVAFVGNGFSMRQRVEGLLQGYAKPNLLPALTVLAISLLFLYILNPEFRSIAY